MIRKPARGASARLTLVVLAMILTTLGAAGRAAADESPSYPVVPPEGLEGPQMGPYPVVVPTTVPPPTSPTQPPAPTTTLIPLVGSLDRFATATEHQEIDVDAGFGLSATYRLSAGPAEAVVSAEGRLIWTPTESDGGKTIDFEVTASTRDRQVRVVEVHVLVSETNSPPTIDGPTMIRSRVGDSISATFTAADESDIPRNAISWSVQGPPGVRIDNGTVTWDIPESSLVRDYTITVTATDDGTPPNRSSSQMTVSVTSLTGQALASIGDGGQPVSPMVIAGVGQAPPLPVDLSLPGQLMAAIVDRTPTVAQIAPAPPSPPPDKRGPITAALNRTAVIQSVQRTFRLLLDLEVPKAAVAGAFAWQLILLFAPGLLARNNELFDISGLGPGQEIGDSLFRFRRDATGLRAGGLRWRSGMWMRSVESPAGAVWIPNANLRSSHRQM